MRTAPTRLRCASRSYSRVSSCIRPPPPQAQSDARAWRDALDPFLPAQLRAPASTSPDLSSTVTASDVVFLLNRTQNASLDILGHLGLVEGRWQTTVWLAKKLVEGGRRSLEPPVTFDPFENVLWRGAGSQSLKVLTESPIYVERVSPARRLHLTLDDLTSAPDSINMPQVETKRAIGQLWRSLGNMILVAAERDSNGSEPIMPFVLEIIAHLHHVGFISHAVYTYQPHESKYALQQPPMLHFLSSKILSALTEATWQAHEASMSAAKADASVSFFRGPEAPSSRYRVRITEIVPELWLELVLWSCLHGGWVLDGTAILETMAQKAGKQSWTPRSWQEVIRAEQEKASSTQRPWKLFSLREDTTTALEDWVRVQRTISGEVVTAFIDGLVNQMRLGVGRRGTDPEYLLKAIRSLKTFLDTHNLSLGSVGWNSIMSRVLDSGGLMPEKRPELLLRIFDLTTGFGTEISATNASATGHDEVPYFFEPTTLPLGLLHRAMRTYIRKEDLDNAISILIVLQRYTDDNKRMSIHQFLEMFKAFPSSEDDEFYENQLQPVDFPAFDLRVPVDLLAKLLNLATKLKMYDIGHWMLFSKDLDGPLIHVGLYPNRKIAASIVRYGTLTAEDDLVRSVMKTSNTSNTKQRQQSMPPEIFSAVFCCQLELQRWNAIPGMQQYVEGTKAFQLRPVILSTFAAELLRTSSGPEPARIEAQEAFTDFLFTWEYRILRVMRNELYCILSIMTTVSAEWRNYCSRFMAITFRQDLKLSTEDFNQVLDGILDGHGSLKGMEIVDIWCHRPTRTFEAYRAPGGLPTMPRFRINKGQGYDQSPEHIEIVQESGARLILHGRVHPNPETIRAILRQVQKEVDQKKGNQQLMETAHADVQRITKWAMQMLHHLGLEEEEIVSDVGSSLLEVTGLEVPTPKRNWRAGVIQSCEEGVPMNSEYP